MQEEVLETTLNENNIVETEVTAIQKDIELDHSKLDNLDYEHSGHTGFQPAGDYVEDVSYVHTDNNYTTEEKTKLSNLENYDDTEIKRDIQSLEDTKVDREVNKGLSTNDYTNEEKSKLASLENYDDTEVKASITSLQTNKADKSEIPDVSNFITNAVDDLVNYYKKSETYTQSEVNALIDLSDYVKNTDYASSSKGGVIRISADYNTSTYNGYLFPQTITYEAYLTKSNQSFISKGTLENVITGKGLVSNTDYATDSKGGVIKVNPSYKILLSNGILVATPLTYQEYTSAGNYAFISKGTLENVITGKELVNKTYVDDIVGDINTALSSLVTVGGNE